jgi:hypothetical protein
MRALLTILALSLALNGQAQKRDRDDLKTMSYIMTAGGVALTIGAAATPGELSRVDGRWSPSPIYQQSARFGGLVAGCAVTLSGGLTMLATMEKRGRRRR